MSYECKILADSISTAGHRLTTYVATFPRITLSEANTHRVLSRNSGSSRAIPLSRQIIRVLDDPFVPSQFGINQAGMQAASSLSGDRHHEAVTIWLQARDRAVAAAYELVLGRSKFLATFGVQPRRELLRSTAPRLATLLDEGGVLNVHKQVVSRLLEPFMWQTVIISATEWSNFFALRTHPDAQPEIQVVAGMMQAAYGASTPTPVEAGRWHLPLLQPDERALAAADPDFWVKVVVGRCARVSYLTHDGVRDPAKDIELYERLVSSGHMSPLEHAARPMTEAEFAATGEWSGNFRGWHQHRKDVPNEADYAQVLAGAMA